MDMTSAIHSQNRVDPPDPTGVAVFVREADLISLATHAEDAFVDATSSYSQHEAYPR